MLNLYSKKDLGQLFRRIELDVTEKCNHSCVACSRACVLIPSKARMTVDQVQAFVDESLELGWKWEMISLLGGEPTMHPDFQEILEVLNEYRKQTLGAPL